MFGTVDEHATADIYWRYYQFTRGLKITIKALAHQNLIAAGLYNVSKPPNGNHPVTIIGDNWEKIPIAQEVARDGVG